MTAKPAAATDAPPQRKRQPTASAAAAKPVADAKRRASIPSRPVIQHTSLFRAELQAALNRANGALLNADNALSVAADDRDMDISLANQRFDAIREGIDAERIDILRSIAGIEAALAATGEPKANVVQLRKDEAAA